MKRKLLIFALCLAMVLTLLPTAALAENSGAWTDAGSYDASWYSKTGTSFTISTAAQLAGLAAIVNGTASGIAADSFAGKTVTLTADVDLAGHSWTPIGTNGDIIFDGTFDGAGYRISNITVSVNGEKAYAGLFGYADDSTLKNITVSGSVTAAGSREVNAGGIAGLIGPSGTAENCTNNASVAASGGNRVYVGGIAGTKFGAIRNCLNAGAISAAGGSAKAGGIAGYSSGPVENCSNTGSVTISGSSTEHYLAGGIAGINYGTLANCCSIGAVSAAGGKENYIGCLAGENDGTAENSYWLNTTVLGTGAGPMTNCASFTEAQGKGTAATLSYTIGSGTAQTGTLAAALNAWVLAQETGTNATTLKYWKQTGGGYPVFCGTWEDALAVKGTVTITGYKINNAWELAQLAAAVNGGANQSGATYTQTADIDLGLYEWVPIGDYRENAGEKTAFIGTYSGSGHSITGMRINAAAIG